MHRYIYWSPRGFSNEFTLYRVPIPVTEKVREWVSDQADDVNAECFFVSAKEANRLARHHRVEIEEWSETRDD